MRIHHKMVATTSTSSISSCVRPHTYTLAHVHTCAPAHLHTCAVANLQMMQTCTHTHLHTCFWADVHTFNNFGFYVRKECLRHMCTFQIITHLVTSKHCTSHRFICNDADPRDTFIAQITHISIDHNVSQHITQSHNHTTIPSEDSIPQHSASDHTTQSHRITSHHTDV